MTIDGTRVLTEVTELIYNWVVEIIGQLYVLIIKVLNGTNLN